MYQVEERSACRICNTPSQFFFYDTRVFFKCPVCYLLFTNETANEEDAEKHYKGQWEESGPEFWKKQVDQLLTATEGFGVQPKKILDFGSGSGAITEELRSRGYDVTPLEPMIHGYLKDRSYPDGMFNVIYGVEVIEHILDLCGELKELARVLEPSGAMFFSTILTDSFIDKPGAEEVFSKWFYKDDQTHVSFFCDDSLALLADRVGCDSFTIAGQVAVFKKRG
jgi:2-polyprenyl-3-methyl-5-hydroxy-6-metoxy-1,4-benzoquinol methylase